MGHHTKPFTNRPGNSSRQGISTDVQMLYYFDVQLVHAFIFIIPCVLISLFKLWTKLVAKSQAEIISKKLNQELVKLV